MGTDSQSDGRIDLERARNTIAKIWFGGAGLCFALVMF
jgi:hypothetical protein